MSVSMKCQASVLRKWLQINSKKCLNWNKMWAILSHMIWKLWIVKLYHTQIPCVVSRYQIIVIFIILNTYMSSVQFSHSIVSDSLRCHGLQLARPSCPTPTPRVYPNSSPLSHNVIQPPHPLSSPSPPTFNLSQHQGLFKWVSTSHQVAKVLEFQLQHQYF